MYHHLLLKWLRRCRNKNLVRQLLLLIGLCVLAYITCIFNYQNSIYTFNSTDVKFRQCNSSKKVAFMKTHKCASSTVENIMFRHAYRLNLNVVIGKVGNYLSEKDLFNQNVLSNVPWSKLEMDVFTLHNRWNFQEVVNLMGPSVRTFSIVRNPIDLFESLFSYLNLKILYGVELKGFVRILQENRTSDTLQKRLFGQMGRNQLAWDLGFDPIHFDLPLDSDEIKNRIAKLDKEFEMVMIAERMDESLILLADLLCWPLEWVVHLDLNIRKPEKKAEAGQQLNDEERRLLADFLRLDVEIYNHFNRRFEEHLSRFNSFYGHQGMDTQLSLLKEKNDKLAQHCVVQPVGNDRLSGKFRDPFTNDIMGYAIHKNVAECEQYAWSEGAFLQYFRTEMEKRSNYKSLVHP